MQVLPNQVVQTVLFGRWQDGNEDRLVFWHANKTGLALDLLPINILAHFGAGADIMAQTQSIEHEWYQIVATRQTVYAQEVVSISPAKDGFDIVSVLPYQIAGLVTAYTGAKRAIAKKYIPALTENDISGGQWDAGTIAILENFASWWLSDMPVTGGGSLVPGLVSSVSGAFIELQSTVVRPIPSTQRRRKKGVGI